MRSSADGVRSISSARALDEFTRPAFAFARARDAFAVARETRDARRVRVGGLRLSTWRASSTEGVIGESRPVDGDEDCIVDESNREGVTHKEVGANETKRDARVGNARDEEGDASGAR